MSAELAAAVCDELVAKGLLKEKPAFIRKDREAKIVKVFEAASLDKAAIATMNGRAIEVAIRNQTQGEAWVQDVEACIKSMLSTEAANDTTGPAESAEMKELRQKMVDNAKVEFADGAMPQKPAGPGGRGRNDDDQSYGSFGGDRGGGGGGRECYNCGKEGHMSRDCPEARQGGGGGGGRECYNCGKEGHQSRDCPEPRQGGDRGGGGGGDRGGGDRGGGGSRACYNCGQEGHQSRDCPNQRNTGEGGGGGGGSWGD